MTVEWESADVARFALDCPLLEVRGPQGAGKTEMLLQRACAYEEAGFAFSRTCMVVNTPDDVNECRNKLLALNPASQALAMHDSQSLALEVLSRSDDGRLAKGCVATTLERSLLVVDLRSQNPDVPVAAQLPRVLARWSRGQQAQGSEEQQVEDLLVALLQRYQLVLPEELSLRALETLQKSQAAAAYEVLLVDDYQNLSEATQRLLSALGAKYLTRTVNTQYQPYSCLEQPARSDSFEEPDQVVVLTAASQSSASKKHVRAFSQAVFSSDSSSYDALVQAGEVSIASSAVQVVKWRTLEDEAAGLGELVYALLQRDSSLRPCDIYVAAPSLKSALAAGKGLWKRRVEYSYGLADDFLASDPRSAAEDGVLFCYARALLAACSDDLISWRVWAALGKKSLSVKTWAAFLTFVSNNKLQGLEAVRAFANLEDIADDLTGLADSFKKGLAFVERAASMTGFSLMKALNPGEDPAFSQLVGVLAEAMTASQVMQAVRQNAQYRVLSQDFTLVKIGSLSHALSQSPRVLVIAGAVEGLVPGARCLDERRSEQARSHAVRQEMELFCHAIDKATDCVVVSYAQKAHEADAVRLGLPIARVKREGEVRRALLKPSRFLAQAQNALPGTQSAEQFLS